MSRVSSRDFSESVDEWQAFPDAQATVPQLQFVRRRGEHFLTMNVLVDRDSDMNGILDGVSAVLAGVQKDGGAVGAHGAAPLQENDVTDDAAAWCDSVSSLTSAIAAGEAEKVVLARRVELQCQAGFDIPVALDRLRSRFPNCTVFAVRDGDDCFLGATPEMLVRLEAGRVRADCLAGSARRGTSEPEDDAIGRALLADDKERREHAMVVRGLVESLREVCVAIDAPRTPSLRKMANVQHLHTPIEARMPGVRHVLELVERLHPTPAVGGLPKLRALCLIKDNERFDRGWYAGPIGWIDAQGGGEFAVALRSALVQGRRAFLYAGCGIVSGSDPEREYEESRIKLEAMRWALSEQT
jgi:isochorismate synthase